MPEFAADAATLPSNSSVDSQIDAALEGVGAEPSVETAPGPDATPEAPPTPTPPVRQSGPPDDYRRQTMPPPAPEETPVEAQPEPLQPDAQAAPADEEVGDPRVTTSRTGSKEWHYPEAKAKILMADRQAMQAIREHIPDFNPQDAIAHYEAFAETGEMKSDFISGDPQRLYKFADEFAKIAVAEKNPQAYPMMVQQSAALLRERVPQVYKQMIANPAIDDSFAPLYEQAFNALREAERNNTLAQNSSDPRIKDAGQKLLMTAQAEVYRLQQTNHQLTERYRTYEDAKNVDPYATRRAELDQQEQRINTFNRQQQQQHAQRWTQMVDTKRQDALTTEIDKGLDRFKEHYKSAPGVLDAIREKAIRTVTAKIGEQRDFMGIYRTELERAWRGQSERDVDAANARYVSRAKAIIASELKRLLPEATKTVIAQSQQQNAALAAGSARKEPSGGAPVRRSIISDPTKVNGKMNWEQEMDTLLGTMRQ